MSYPARAEGLVNMIMLGVKQGGIKYHFLSLWYDATWNCTPISRDLELHPNLHWTQLSKFLRRSLIIFMIESFRTIVFIFFVISTTFRPICPSAFFRCLSNSGTYTELRTTSFIEFTGVACSGSVSHNWVQVLSIPVLLLACSQDLTCNPQMIVSLEA